MGYRKLGRTSDQRKAMLRDLATSLIISERIETTEAAKTLRNVEILNEDDSTQTALQKLFGEIAERYSERQGGYTRILKVGPRRGDGAESVIIELV